MVNRVSVDARGSDYICPVQLCLVWLQHRLDVQLRPGDLVPLNTRYGNTECHVLSPINLRSMKAQFGPHSISFNHFAKYLYTEIRHRREEEAPVFPHSCRSNKVSFWVKRLLTTCFFPNSTLVFQYTFLPNTRTPIPSSTRSSTIRRLAV